jgi:hypothetical protein
MNRALQVLEKSGNCSVIRESYADLLGNMVAAIVLGQIAYWFHPGKNGKSKLRVKKKGVLWLAKSRAEWASECYISPRQFDSALKLLITRGFIQKKLMRFAGNPTIHLWLDESALVSALTKLPKRELRIACKGKIHFTENVISLTEIKTETTTDLNPAAVAALEIKANPTYAKTVGKQNINSEILKKHMQKQKSKSPQQKTLSLVLYWKTLLENKYNTIAEEVTAKERGLLKLLNDKLGENTRAVMAYAVNDWAGLCFEVKVDKAIVNVPERPEIWFLINHYDTVMQLIAKQKPKKVTKPVQDDDFMLWKKPEIKHEKASQAEIHALMAEFIGS